MSVVDGLHIHHFMSMLTEALDDAAVTNRHE